MNEGAKGAGQIARAWQSGRGVDVCEIVQRLDPASRRGGQVDHVGAVGIEQPHLAIGYRDGSTG